MPTKIRCIAHYKSGKHKGKRCTCAARFPKSDRFPKYCGQHAPQKFKLAVKDIIVPKITKAKKIVQSDGKITIRYSHDLNIYPNQAVAAQKIVRHFMAGVQAVTLNAQMQSGKTDTIKAINIQLSEQIYKRHGQCMISFAIVPVIDNDILAQTRKELTPYGFPYEYIFTIPQLKNNTDIIRDSMEKHRKQDPNCYFLIAIDESHLNTRLDSQNRALTYDTLKNAGIYINGSRIKKNVFLLTVSATPNAELASLSMDRIKGKKVKVTLNPGSGYYGVVKMFENNKIKQGYNLNTEVGENSLINYLLTKNCLKKYAIIRVPKSCKHARDFAAKLAESGIRSITYDSKDDSKAKLSDIINLEPDRFTVIVIVNRARASLQLNTSNICLVHENISADVDTTAQGLVGRAAGYGKEEHGVEIYCNLENAKLYRDWVKTDFSIKSIPKTSMTNGGLTPASVKNKSSKWVQHKPICGKLNRDQQARIDRLSTSWGGRKFNSKFYGQSELTEIVTTIISSVSLDDRYKVPYKNNGIMAIKSDTAERQFWTGKNTKKPHHNFDVDVPSDENSNKTGYYLYINLNGGTEHGKWRLYYTERTSNNCSEEYIEPIVYSTYHPNHSPPVLSGL